MPGAPTDVLDPAAAPGATALPPARVGCSVVVPVYRNRESLPELLDELEALDRDLGGRLEAVFVVDGSPDHSLAWLREHLPRRRLRSTLIALARNFGSFAAIRAGMTHARGPHFAVMAADLQDPPALVRGFFDVLDRDGADVVIGERTGRGDPWSTRLASGLFWRAYRWLVQPQIPVGGVDLFGCNQLFRNQLVSRSTSSIPRSWASSTGSGSGCGSNQSADIRNLWKNCPHYADRLQAMELCCCLPWCSCWSWQSSLLPWSRQQFYNCAWPATISSWRRPCTKHRPLPRSCL